MISLSHLFYRAQNLPSSILSPHIAASTLLIPAVCRTRVKYEPSIWLRSPWLLRSSRAPARFLGGHRFESCRGLRFFSLSHAREMLIISLSHLFHRAQNLPSFIFSLPKCFLNDSCMLSCMAFVCNYSFLAQSPKQRKLPIDCSSSYKSHNARFSPCKSRQGEDWCEVLLFLLRATTERGHANELWSFLLPVLSGESCGCAVSLSELCC